MFLDTEPPPCVALHKAAAVHVDLELYTPGEAEAITQVSQATVRNWRRAKHLPRHQGHARYDIAELLIQASMRARVSRGVAPESAKGYSSEIAKAAFSKHDLQAQGLFRRRH